MKPTILILAAGIVLSSCSNQLASIVSPSFTDSLIAHYTPPSAVRETETDMVFWKNRIDPLSTGLVNESRYAALLVSRFHQSGNITDLQMADSLLNRVNATYNEKETGPLLALARNAVLQHRFRSAGDYLQKARLLGLKKYEALTASFDVDFELGNYADAAQYVKQLQPFKDYGYFFRRSKLDHYNGEMDSAIHAMLMASTLAENSDYLKGVALSNAADLYIHAGELQKANDLYTTCIRINSGDLHSITGLGWIALVHDKNDSLASRLFAFVQTKTSLPDPLFKLYQVAEQKKDSNAMLNYARQFEAIATDSAYGNMYNKYLIELYTGVLQQPAKAVAIAARELPNRATPQTHAWYAWALFANHQQDQAWKVYQQFVSGKPLEGLELYWMGKLMQGLGKGYNAKEFFKAAWKNKYDLSPAMVIDLEKSR